MTYYAHRRGENFGNQFNKVDNTVSGSWTIFGLIEDADHIIHFEAVLWNGTSGSFLFLRDKYGDVIYFTINAAPMLKPDVLPSFITTRLPIFYLTNESGSSIRVFGEYN